MNKVQSFMGGGCGTVVRPDVSDTEICSSNPVINDFIYCQMYREEDKNERKRGRERPILK